MAGRWLAVLMAALAGCTQSGPADAPAAGDVCRREVVEPEKVSIVALLGNPEKFDGRPVRVFGFYHGSFEHSAIYLAENDFRHRLHANGLWVAGQVPDALNDQYVLLEGIFTAADRGHLGLWSGGICNLKRVAAKSRADNPTTEETR